jgi:hypothetical protein
MISHRSPNIPYLSLLTQAYLIVRTSCGHATVVLFFYTLHFFDDAHTF